MLVVGVYTILMVVQYMLVVVPGVYTILMVVVPGVYTILMVVVPGVYTILMVMVVLMVVLMVVPIVVLMVVPIVVLMVVPIVVASQINVQCVIYHRLSNVLFFFAQKHPCQFLTWLIICLLLYSLCSN